MVWLPDSEKSLRIRLAVSTNYLSVTDGQTDGHLETAYSALYILIGGTSIILNRPYQSYTK